MTFAILFFGPQIAMPYQVLAATDLVGVAIGNDEEVVGHGGNGVVVVVGNDDAVVFGPLPDHGLHIFNTHRVNLRKRFIQDVEGRVAMQYQI